MDLKEVIKENVETVLTQKGYTLDQITYYDKAIEYLSELLSKPGTSMRIRVFIPPRKNVYKGAVVAWVKIKDEYGTLIRWIRLASFTFKKPEEQTEQQ